MSEEGNLPSGRFYFYRTTGQDRGTGARLKRCWMMHGRSGCAIRPGGPLTSLFAHTDLERVLTGHGLYPKEARAMIETWRDSWFEEGTRLFYIFSKQSLDSVLPLTLQPAPTEVTRVFVGRMEIITPEIQDDVREALLEKDLSTLERYGRFLQPIAERIGVSNDPLLNSASSSYDSRATTCTN